VRWQNFEKQPMTPRTAHLRNMASNAIDRNALQKTA
jgi:hypothetical protein